MTRKRYERATTDVRYRLKVFKLHGVQPPQSLVDELSNKMWAERQGGWRVYRRIWTEVLTTLMNEGVSSVLYVPYRAAAFEYYNKVLLKGAMKPEDWFDKWDKTGLDPRLLRMIVDVVEKAVGARAAL